MLIALGENPIKNNRTYFRVNLLPNDNAGKPLRNHISAMIKVAVFL